MTKMTGSKFLADTLVGYGATHVFHVPTAFFGTLVDLEGTDVKRILTHGEKAVAYMADAYARASGRPGIAMAQSIGAANLAAGIADPFMACSPVIALTHALHSHERYRHGYQEFEHTQFGPVTKWSATVDNTKRLPDMIRQAFRVATTGTPGPVHLDIHPEVMDAEADLEVYIEEQFSRVPPFRPEPELDKVKQAARLLEKASEPVIMAGGGVMASGAWNEIQELAEKLTIPVVSTLDAKSCIPNTHPLCGGVMGRYGHWYANRIISAADLVLMVGARAGGMSTADWKFPPRDMPTIQININPEELGRNYKTKVALLGDAKVTLRHLIGELEPRTPDASRLAEVQRAKEQWSAEYEPLKVSDAMPLRPERICRELTNILPEDSLLVCDTGHSGVWTANMIDLKYPGNNYLRAAGSLGWALPASMGAKCGAPNRPVVCFTGDGGFWYHIGELETAVRHGINPVIVVNDNRSLNQEWNPIRAAYGGEIWGKALELFYFTDVNLAQVAQSMGCYAERVERPEDIEGAIKRSLASDRIAVVDVATDSEALGPVVRSQDMRPSASTPFDV